MHSRIAVEPAARFHLQTNAIGGDALTEQLGPSVVVRTRAKSSIAGGCFGSCSFLVSIGSTLPMMPWYARSPRPGARP